MEADAGIPLCGSCYLPWHEHKIGYKYDLGDTKLVTNENEEKKFYHSNGFLTKIDPRNSDMTDTHFRDEQHGARESYDKPCPEPKELEQTLVMESDAGTPEQLPIKTTYSQGQHKKQTDEILSSNKLELYTSVQATEGDDGLEDDQNTQYTTMEFGNFNLDKTKSFSSNKLKLSTSNQTTEGEVGSEENIPYTTSDTLDEEFESMVEPYTSVQATEGDDGLEDDQNTPYTTMEFGNFNLDKTKSFSSNKLKLSSN